MYTSKKWFALIAILLLVLAVTATGCGGVQETADEPAADVSQTDVEGWTLIPLNIASDNGIVRIDFAARNDSEDWGSIEAASPEDKPTVLTKDGKDYTCDTVQVTSDGHYLPPGFQMQGFISKREGKQTLYVECQVDGEVTGGSLVIPYTLTRGEYDYYEKGENVFETQFEVDLSQSPATLTYPLVSSEPEVEVHSLTEEIATLNKTTLKNTGVNRSGDEISFQWQVTNPGEYGTKVHIGRPPAIGNDGIVYGVRVSPDIVDVDTAKPDGGISEFETMIEVPSDVEGLYMLLSVEQSRERLFANYLVDLTDLN